MFLGYISHDQQGFIPISTAPCTSLIFKCQQARALSSSVRTRFLNSPFMILVNPRAIFESNVSNSVFVTPVIDVDTHNASVDSTFSISAASSDPCAWTPVVLQSPKTLLLSEAHFPMTTSDGGPRVASQLVCLCSFDWNVTCS